MAVSSQMTRPRRRPRRTGSTGPNTGSRPTPRISSCASARRTIGCRAKPSNARAGRLRADPRGDRAGGGGGGLGEPTSSTTPPTSDLCTTSGDTSLTASRPPSREHRGRPRRDLVGGRRDHELRHRHAVGRERRPCASGLGQHPAPLGRDPSKDRQRRVRGRRAACRSAPPRCAGRARAATPPAPGPSRSGARPPPPPPPGRRSSRRRPRRNARRAARAAAPAEPAGEHRLAADEPLRRQAEHGPRRGHRVRTSPSGSSSPASRPRPDRPPPPRPRRRSFRARRRRGCRPGWPRSSRRAAPRRAPRRPAGESVASSPPRSASRSTASTPTAPPLVTIPSRARLSGRNRATVSAAANISLRPPTRSTPARRSAASATSSAPDSMPGMRRRRRARPPPTARP